MSSILRPEKYYNYGIMHICITAFILIALLSPKTLFADIFRWIDGQNTQHYTGELESIPETYRSNAQLLPLSSSSASFPESKMSSSRKESVTIPFSPGSLVLVNATINGVVPVRLILDTGSDRTVILPSVLAKSGLSVEKASQSLIKGITGTAHADRVWVKSIEVGETKVGPILLIAHEADLFGADGLLGSDVLANFKVTIDSGLHVVTLSPN
jgi:predicted aspartyl protease